ncbi:hypothetical protein [Phenylobacterium sp.]|nr:hypothetical protein [Phenylobacterium sp.]
MSSAAGESGVASEQRAQGLKSRQDAPEGQGRTDGDGEDQADPSCRS